MTEIDVLLITALKEEHDAARDVALSAAGSSFGVARWEERDTATATPYLLGKYVGPGGRSINVALARPTRMGATSTSPIVASLVERLKPRCLAMCGVCAGNPNDVALGDVIIAEMVYAYDEGKQKKDVFEGDHRQTPMPDTWVRAAQDMLPDDLPSFGPASIDESKHWVLERLYAGDDPRTHPARNRYFPKKTWSERVRALESDGLVRRNGTTLVLTDDGKAFVEETLFYDPEGPQKLPFQIKVGPIASGNVVVKDGVTWENLKKWGVRSVLGLEMEAAAIGSAAHRLNVPTWIVVKGVMDHADPRKDDRYKPFAARASAEVLFKFLLNQATPAPVKGDELPTGLVRTAYVIGGVAEETDYQAFEQAELGHLCTQLGEAIAAAGAELVVCSPFPDSADIHCVLGYVRSRIGGTVHFHSPRHPSVAEHKAKLQMMLGDHKTRMVDWNYPAPENDESWPQAWLLCQLQALDYADVVIAIGGRISKTANTLLHLAEARGIPVVPFAFLGGAAQRAFKRRDWPNLHPGMNYEVLLDKRAVGKAMKIADRLLSDRIRGSRHGHSRPKKFFVSRARHDSGYATELVTHLARAGFVALLGDTEIRDESTVQSSIEDAILRSDVCIVLWSGFYARSRWCYDELEFALQRESVGEMRVWLFNLDGSDIVPREARRLPQVVTRTPRALVEAVSSIIEGAT